MKIGHGFDIHRFENDKPLVLGGVTIPYPQGMRAHSDGDVVLHALCDALLGAAGLGDIGVHFDDQDPKWKDTNSRVFLRHAFHLLETKNYKISNIDITIVAQAPKLRPYIENMCENICVDLKMTRDNVNIKATTMEELGPIGEKKAIAAYAVVLLK